MAKAIFITKVEPTYDDRPDKRYHFPRTYVRQVEAAIGDWIIYYEPRRTTGNLSSRGGRQAYFATARVTAVVPDPAKPDHYYALMSDYLEFAHPVRFKLDGVYLESALRKDDGSTNKGVFGRSVRLLPDEEFEAILNAGYAPSIDGPQRVDDTLEFVPGGLAENTSDYDPYPPELQKRPIVQRLISRPFRERAFTTAVKSAYRNTCAITRIRMINGGGRSEVQAAHIRAVAEDGPDSIQNGIALSGTIHWMFDRHLISIDDNYRLLIAHKKIPNAIHGLLPADGAILLPSRPELRPHRSFLAFHRSKFKG